MIEEELVWRTCADNVDQTTGEALLIWAVQEGLLDLLDILYTDRQCANHTYVLELCRLVWYI